jgi:hypothetical protein
MLLILSPVAANAQELALRYLLALSSDIRTAALLREDGRLLASAPDPLDDSAAADARQLVGAALGFRHGTSANPMHDEPIELDILCSRDSVYVLADGGVALVCVAERQALPGIVLHEMRSVLGDLDGGEATLRRERA